VETLVIGKLDATANEWSRKDVYSVSGFPTLYFKPAGKAPMTYDGAREPAAMASWLAAQATHSFEVPAALSDAPALGAPPKKKGGAKRKAAAEPPRGAPEPGSGHGDEL
jgi:hypothetical protein